MPQYSIPGLIAPLMPQHRSLSIDEICQHLGYSTIPPVHGNLLVLDKGQTGSLTQNQTHDTLPHDSHTLLQGTGITNAVFNGVDFPFAKDVRGTDVYGNFGQKDFPFAEDIRDTNVYLSLNTGDGQNEFSLTEHMTHISAGNVTTQDDLHAQDDVLLSGSNFPHLSHTNQYVYDIGIVQASNQTPLAHTHTNLHNHRSDNGILYSFNSTAQVSGNSPRSYGHHRMEYINM